MSPELTKPSYQLILQGKSIQTSLLSIQIDKYKMNTELVRCSDPPVLIESYLFRLRVNSVIRSWMTTPPPRSFNVRISGPSSRTSSSKRLLLLRRGLLLLLLLLWLLYVGVFVAVWLLLLLLLMLLLETLEAWRDVGLWQLGFPSSTTWKQKLYLNKTGTIQPWWLSGIMNIKFK